MRKADVAMLITQSNIINQYKLAAQASQRGFARLHRKLDSWKTRCAFLEQFIREHQMTGALEELEARIKRIKRQEWESKNEV